MKAFPYQMSFFNYAIFGFGIIIIILLCMLFANVTKIPWKGRDDGEEKNKRNIKNG